MSSENNGDESLHGADPTADGRALAALFASLVQDAPASELSPEKVIELGKKEHNRALDQRIKRGKYGRNLLLAAALAALAAIVLPKLGHPSAAVSSARSSPSAASSAELRQPGSASDSA